MRGQVQQPDGHPGQPARRVRHRARGEYAEGTYWATKVSLTIVNDTNTDQEFRIRYVDVQDGDRVWVQGTRFTDGLPNNVVPANSSRPFEIEVWHNVVSGADVPDDLTLDFGFELA